MDSAHTILSHSFTVICTLTPPPQHTHTPIRVYAVNNKSCVTSQITQTAYHLFIVVYHNNSWCVQKPQQVRHGLLLMNLEDYQIWKLTDSVAGPFPIMCMSLSSVYPPETKYGFRERLLWGSTELFCGVLSNNNSDLLYTAISSQSQEESCGLVVTVFQKWESTMHRHKRLHILKVWYLKTYTYYGWAPPSVPAEHHQIWLLNVK